MKMRTKTVEKPWGRNSLPEAFGGEQAKRIGEIWFAPRKGIKTRLMVKYLFTSARLSIQVHPDDRLAKRAGLAHGKDECWLVIDAEPDAEIGIGLVKDVSPTKLKAAASVGTMEQLIDWKPVQVGDFYYVPAGTIHAIGAGVTLMEIQQNIDITYRLYDYGRDRELHLDEAIKAAKTQPYDMGNHFVVDSETSSALFGGKHFNVFQVIGDDAEIVINDKATEWHIMPVDGETKVGRSLVAAGECAITANFDEVDFSMNIRCIVACDNG